MKSPYRILSLLLPALFSLVALVGLVLLFLPKNIHNNKNFSINSGQSLSMIAQNLENQGIIRNQRIFALYVFLRGEAKRIQAGSYNFKGTISTQEVAELIIQSGGQANDIEVTIPEGSNIAEVEKILVSKNFISKGSLLKDSSSLEGFLFPDTYRFAFGSNSELIIKKMKDEFEYKITSLKIRDNIDIKKVITIASILEKEAKSEQDMRLVSGIIKKRLELGMALQIDATVAYGACKKSFNLGKYCDVSQIPIRQELEIDSAYNTYTRTGLPAGPISNPGIAAIKAALQPQPSQFLYYLSKNDGVIVYSKTFEEHEIARAKYILR